MQRAMAFNFREVVRLHLTPEGGGDVWFIEAFVVPEISTVTNEHLEVARESYSHLANIWLFDVCQNKEQYKIDVLIGEDYL